MAKENKYNPEAELAKGAKVDAKCGQTATATAKAFAKTINSGARPYRATATGSRLKVVYKEK